MSESCPFCAEPVTPGAERCAQCGESLRKGAPCDLHPLRAIVGACPDCGQYVCEDCRDPATRACLRCEPARVDAAGHYDVGQVLGAVTRDPDWVTQVLIGAACLLGSVLFFPLFALMGYRLRIIRGQRRRPDRDALPDWSGFGELIGDGFKVWLAVLLPALCGVVPLMALGAGCALALERSRGKGDLFVLGVAGLVVVVCIYVLFVLALTYAMPAIEMEYLESGSVLSGLRLGNLRRRMFSDAVDYLILFLLHYLIQQVLSGLGVLLCFVGLYASVPWAWYTDGILFGRYLAKQDQERAAADAAKR